MNAKFSARTRHWGRVLVLTLLVSIIGSSAVRAQDDQEYKRTFNEGLSAMKAFQTSKKMSDADKAYTSFERTVPLAKEQKADDIAAKSNQYLARLDYMRGTVAFKAGKVERAIASYDKGLAHDPTYDRNHYGKGLALKKQDKIDEAMAEFKIASESRDSKTKRAATKAIRDHFVFVASTALNRHGDRTTVADADEAINNLKKLQEFIPADADVYYYMAEAFKVKQDYKQSVAMANQALKLHRGSKSDKAKIYFVKGESLMAIQNYAEAKLAFKRAAVGQYRASAEHYLETLGTK